MLPGVDTTELTIKPRHRRLLELLQSGESVEQAAKTMGVSPITAQTYYREIWSECLYVARHEGVDPYILWTALVASPVAS